MTSRTLLLDWPPTANTYYRNVGGRVLISAKGRAFRDGVVSDCSGVPRIDGRLSVRVMLYPPNRRAFDVDNRLKPLLDAMEKAGVYENDGQIDRLEIVRGSLDPNKQGHCIVHIEVIPGSVERGQP